MNILLGISDFLVNQILTQSAIFMGLLAMIGLILAKEKTRDILDGTIKTMGGLLMFGIGCDPIVDAISKLSLLLESTIGVTGYFPNGSTNTNWVLASPDLGKYAIIAFAIGWFMHLFLVKFFPKRFKVLFLTCHLMLNVNAMLCLFWFYTMGLRGIGLVVAGAVSTCMWLTLIPMISYKACNEITEGGFALAHGGSLVSMLAYRLGGLIGDPEKDDCEDLELPGFLSVLSDPTLLLSVSVPAMFLIVAFASLIGSESSKATLFEMAGSQNWILWSLLCGLKFVAGVSIVKQGMKNYLAVIVRAMKGISDRFLPGVVPGLDVAAFYPFSDVACVMGFLGACAAALISFAAYLILKTPIIILPSLEYCFWEGAGAGVFGNCGGGWKGALLGGLLVGFAIHIGAYFLIPMIGAAPLETGIIFSNTDTNVIGPVAFRLIHWISMLFH